MRLEEENSVQTERIQQRALTHFHKQLDTNYREIDRLFGMLMIFQWFVGLAFALFVFPNRWPEETLPAQHPFLLAFLLGGLLTGVPVFFAFTQPGALLTRRVIAVSQMLMGALLIHLTGGRIETHFHVFGSLAFLAFYRDWSLLVIGTVIVAVDHLIRGFFLPQSVYGIHDASHWRWLEHAAWVIFEDVILIKSCLRGRQEMITVAERQAELEEIMENVRGEVLGRMAELNNQSEALAASSRQMGSNSEQTERSASTVSSASEQTNRNVQAVATAAEEMTATLKEISKNVMKATQITSEAVKVAEGTHRTIGKLGESSAEIGKVVKVITAIAQQTNLLALNAAIEAARAGEAGKGFAVVANEVKDLAKKTAKATEEIGQKISVIQTDTKEAVTAIGEISGIIAQINEIATTISGAVEEQTATTNEISRSVSEAARGTGEVTGSIGGVVSAAKSTAEGAAGILAASQKLAQMSAELMEMVGRFQADRDRERDRGGRSELDTRWEMALQ
jgi:methyl-accepting chemotaxis protein